MSNSRMTESEYIAKLDELWPESDDMDILVPLQLAKEAVVAFPASAKLHCMHGDLIQLAWLRTWEGDFPKAEVEACYAHALAVDPSCAEAYESMGYLLDMDDELDKADSSFRQAIEWGAGADSYAGWARVRAQLGQDQREILSFLEGCPYADALIVRKLRSEIAEGDWDKV